VNSPLKSGVVVAFSCLLLLFQGASAATKIAARDVGRQASSLPEFKTNPHVVESEGNQISGVVRTILQDRKGDLWFGTHNGLQRYDGTSLVHYDLRDELGKGLTARAIAEDGAGHVWIGTSSGLFAYDGEFLTRYTVADGLGSNDVWSVAVDSSGTVWAGTFEGACRLAGDAFTAFPIPPATKRDDNKGVWGPNVVWSMTEDRAGNLWFEAESGLYKYGGGVLSRVTVEDQGTEASVSSDCENKSVHTWLSTRSTGLIKFDRETFTNAIRQAGLDCTRTGPLCEDSAGNIWLGVPNAGVYRFDGTSFTLYDTKDGLSTSFVFCIVEDNAGRIWCGGQKGAYRFDGTSFVNVTRNGPW
jgi:ligand-binding sensor domain-containing protein